MINSIELLEEFENATGLDSGFRWSDEEYEYIIDLIKKDIING